jgi:hypothetical protein
LKLDIRRSWLLGGIAIIVLLWALSLMPSLRDINVPDGDKYGHLLAYGGTMWWWAQLWAT